MSITFLLACNEYDPAAQIVESADYKKAESFFDTNSDSAFYYFNKVVTTSIQPLEIAMAYNQMAVIQYGAGDYFGSQESLTTSLTYLNPKKVDDHACLASDYNELGNTSLKLQRYRSAVDFYDTALKFTTDTSFSISILNNKGLAYQKNRDYSQALKIFEAALVQTTRQKTYARILTNIAKTKWLADSTYNPVPDLRRALDIRINEKDRWGQNSSYMHLADYYLSSKPDSSAFYAKAWLASGIKLDSPDDKMEALEKLIRVSPRPNDAKTYFIRFAKLRDSVETARNAAKNQFALIRYEVEKHKADNSKLQHENDEKQRQVIALVLGILIVLFVAVVWYRKLRLEAKYKLRQNELKMSRKVHDVVANGLYRVMNEVEHHKQLDKEYLLDQLEILYDRSRDISYEDSAVANSSFKEQINALLTPFGTEVRRVSIVGNEDELWDSVGLAVKQEIMLVLQELMVNMDKHSRACNVVVKFEQIENQITIYYADDGIGINGTPNFKNGLTNTGNRIRGIGGSITFDSENDKGLKIHISFPAT
ncbi:tetratricopeptide repeat-containing sensor histidine kinase [Pedobacter psychroterrae]|uniref:Tetratricopeptide repeat protein n=1 Tax=Pedobacter psychroterrae TaxID=2530453 RepID=A0A4R0NJG3_9SPHI|nr:tetratricopeptide repeat-containing sensor histidine kinase [Pedobacter psychroterrae]TCC99957.1 tetratricopeptide repeat protein [Pedobacter psychroterrae]